MASCWKIPSSKGPKRSTVTNSGDSVSHAMEELDGETGEVGGGGCRWWARARCGVERVKVVCRGGETGNERGRDPFTRRSWIAHPLRSVPLQRGGAGRWRFGLLGGYSGAPHTNDHLLNSIKAGDLRQSLRRTPI